MKRISSFILAFIISITCIFSAGISYADNRPHIEHALNNLQTQAGYIPFQNSSVQYNCFGFIVTFVHVFTQLHIIMNSK